MPRVMYESEYLARLLVRTDARIASVHLPAFREALVESREAIAKLRYRLTRDDRAMPAARTLHVEDV